jgi:type I restriction enzyme S subunit
LKKGYKQTEVGVIPDEWEVKTLGSLTTLLTNGFVGTATTAYVESDDGILYIQGYNVQENGFDFHGIKRVSKVFHARNKKSCLQLGDLLTIQTGDIGVTTVVPPELAGANCHALIISRLRKQDSDPGYYCQYFNSERGRITFKEIETGTTMKHLNGGDMKRLFLPSPPIEEQRAIAKALSDVDELLGGLNRLIAKKRDLKQATMQQLLTGKTRLPGFKGEWEVTRIGESIDLLTGFPFPSAEYCDVGVRLLRGSNVKRGVTDWSDDLVQCWPRMTSDITRYELREGDLVIAMDGSLVGRSYARLQTQDLPAVLLQRVARIRSGKLDIGYLTQFVGSDIFISYCDSVKTVTAIPHISPSDIRNFTIPIPSDIAEQTAIAEVLSDMDAELVALEQRREKALALKQAMMQELLTGRTRLI